ncbi:MAG: glycoside hydrolase family 57 protein, partial [Bacteroidales bacterium]|nr:glycoside hydrolase family 57 protein [Bacteroidales bacterium]
HFYFDDYRNKYILGRIAEKCYLPMNYLLLELIREYGSAFKISFSLSGTVLDQFERFAPQVLESFIKLAETGSAEFLAETYSHSLSAMRSEPEFKRQVDAQKEKIKYYFKQDSSTFRNTELIYSDEIGEMVARMGFNTMLTEGARHILSWKSPNYMYCNAINPKLKVLLKNFRLSDDIAFRFSQQSWDGWPLTAEKFVGWLNDINPSEETVNLFMDYETFGEHQWKETGIFDFMKALPQFVFSKSKFTFNTPSELSHLLQPKAAVNVPHPISWADEERDLTAWLGNELQRDAFHKLYDLEEKVKNSPDEKIQLDWKYLQTSDHFYYMCTKWFSDGDVHKYFNPYNSPYEAYINYMNVLSDFIIRLQDMHPVNYVEKTDNKTEDVSVSVKKEKKTRQVKKSVKTTIPTKSANLQGIKDVLTLNKTSLRKLLKDTDVTLIYQALTGADKKVKKYMLINLGKLQLREYNQLAYGNANVSPDETSKAQKKLAAKIKKVK